VDGAEMSRDDGWWSLFKMTGPQRLLEAGALLNTTAFFAAMPFAPLYLDAYTELSKAAIGAVVGALYLFGAFGMVGGAVVDRLGATRVMQAGLLLSAVLYCLLIVARRDAFIVALFVALGPARLLVEPGSKKLLSLAAEGDERVFRRRYMTWCLGAIIGPAISSVMFPISPRAFFVLPAALYLVFLVTVTLRRAVLLALEEGHRGRAETAGSWRIAVRDRRLLQVISGGLVLFVVFSQFETMIPLYIRTHFPERAGQYFAVLFILNAVLAVALQVPIDRLSGRLRRSHVLTVGSASFALSFVMFWVGGSSLPLLCVAVVFWTLGEGTLVPIPDMLVHKIAPVEHKGMYFGLSDIRQVGFFAGPVLGGFLLGAVPLYFLAMSALIFACLPFLLSASQPQATARVPAEPKTHPVPADAT
jgi:MFS family permease